MARPLHNFAPGAIEGPFRRPRALTVTWTMRLVRAIRRALLRRRSPL